MCLVVPGQKAASNNHGGRMIKFLSYRWPSLIVAASVLAGAALAAPGHAAAVTGGVQVSDQGDCTVGPTNVNHLSTSQTAYVWLIFTSQTSVRGYTYEITGTNSSYDSGILRIRFQQCRRGNVNDWVAKFTTPATPGGYTLTVFDATGAKVSSDNFTL